jgi:hypothetical protein
MPRSTEQIEPPPAATLSTATAGDATRTPPTAWVGSRSTVPSIRATSVEVPPMSKASARGRPERTAARAAPAAPPAGPEEARLSARTTRPEPKAPRTS